MGLELGRYRWTYPARRQQILTSLRIGTLLDVGANVGQYGAAVRSAGFRGTIHSFEPVSEPFRRLRERTASDPAWHAHQYAIGATSDAVTINVSERSIFSSVLPIAHESLSRDPAAHYVRTETVQQRTLDERALDLLGYGDRVALKIDVQGLERDVLQGATEVLRRATFLEVELSPEPIYAGQPVMVEMLEWLSARGYVLSLVENLLPEPDSGRALQFNGIFVRLGGAATPAP
jgi:FkbM family methyltransferase